MGINKKNGFALLIAVVFVAVVLALGTALSSLAYKQQILVSGGARSQYAFYAADAALECALYDTQRLANSCGNGKDPYGYLCHYAADPNHPPISYQKPACYQGYAFPYFQELCYNAAACPNQRVVKQTFPIAFTDPLNPTNGQESLCADVTVYEDNTKSPGNTYVFAQGYDVPCAQVGGTNRIVARGIYAHF